MAGIIEVTKGSMPTIHNTRQGDMTAEELSQCLLDIKVTTDSIPYQLISMLSNSLIQSWLQSHAAAAVKIGDPASDSQIESLKGKLGVQTLNQALQVQTELVN